MIQCAVFLEREAHKNQFVDLTRFFPAFDESNDLIDEGAERLESAF